MANAIDASDAVRSDTEAISKIVDELLARLEVPVSAGSVKVAAELLSRVFLFGVDRGGKVALAAMDDVLAKRH